MRKRALIVVLLLSTMLAAAIYIAGAYLALASAVSTLPKTFAHARGAAQVAAPARESRAAAPVEPEQPRVAPPAQPEQVETDGEHAMHAAMEKDPDIAALVDDRDPQISAAMRAFFVDGPKP